MSFLLPVEILLSVCFLGVLGALLLVAAANHFFGDDVLVFLDGRPAFSALDEHAHERLTLEARLAEDAEVSRLDDWYALKSPTGYGAALSRLAWERGMAREMRRA